MDASNAKVKLEKFEGPLDLLLSLITKNEINIYDIPIAEITRQYMQYLYDMEMLDIELAGEFIVMAAQLIEIKSKMMLPPDENEDDEEDPREELAKRLAEYRIYKMISEYIKGKEPRYNAIVTKQQEYYPELSAEYEKLSINSKLLAGALAAILQKNQIKVEDTFSYRLEYKEIPTEEKIFQLRENLKTAESIDFFSLFINDFSKANIIATFMAILEMLKANEIEITQNEIYADIIITKKKDI